MKSKYMNFKYVEEFVDEVISRVDNGDEVFLSIFAKYGQACGVIKELLKYSFVKLSSIEFLNDPFESYDEEYVMDVWSSEGVTYVGCEPAKRHGKYFNYEGDICYLLGDCSSKIMNTCKYDEMYDVVIDEYEEEPVEAGSVVNISEDDNGDIKGFTASKNDDSGYYSYSYYTTSVLGRDEIQSILKHLGF